MPCGYPDTEEQRRDREERERRFSEPAPDFVPGEFEREAEREREREAEKVEQS